MEAVAAAAAMVDLNTLSRRELQALCKLNGVRANMTNLAMVEALQSLPSVDGIDQVGTTLCLPTPGKSAMKSALRTTEASESDKQQQGSPLPRGRRVSVKSPEAIRMDADGEEDDTKRGLVREIVRTPGVALRSTSRRQRATPAPLPTPAAGTLRRSQRSTVRKATAPVEEVDVSTTKRSTRKTAVPKVMLDFDQEEEDAAAAAALEEDKVQQVVEPKASSDERCGDPVEEELLEDGNNKGDEPEQAVGGAAAIGEEEKLVNAEKLAPLSAMEGSPILGILSKAAPEPAIKNVENASVEDREVLGNWSPVLELADEIKSVSEDKVAVEVPERTVNEDAVNSTVEDAVTPSNMVPAAMAEKTVVVDESAVESDLVGERSEEADRTKQSSEVDDLDQEDEDMLKADRTVHEECDDTTESVAAPNKIVPSAITVKEVAVDEVPQVDLTDDESPEEYEMEGESSEEADLTEESSKVDDLNEQEEEDMLKADWTVDEESEIIESAAAPNNMVSAAVTEKEVSADDLPQADLIDDESAEDCGLAGESSEITESAAAHNNMVSADDLPQADLTHDENAKEYDLASESSEEADLTEESSEMDDLDEDDDDMVKADHAVDEESDYTIEVSNSIDVNLDSDEEEEQLKMLETGEETKEADESHSLTGEEDDFSSDLSSEFDDLGNFSGAETASGNSPVALGVIDSAAASSAAKTVESVITEELELSSEGDVVSQHVDTIVKPLDEVTITQEKKEECPKEKKQLKVGKEMSLRKLKSAYKDSIIAAKVELSSEGDVVSQHVETIFKPLDEVTITQEKKEECPKEKKQLKVGKEMSLRKLKSAYKESLIAAKEGKNLTIASDEVSRMALAELDNNAEC